MSKRDMHAYMTEKFDRLHILTPKGTKERLREKFAAEGKGMNVNRYVNSLIELDAQGKVDWSGFHADR